MLKTFLASSDRHVSSSVCASVNYFGRLSGDKLQALHESMRNELGEFVIVDGSDNWSAKDSSRPEMFARAFTESTGMKLLAYYHSKTSGITKSGIVVAPEVFDAMTQWYTDTYTVWNWTITPASSWCSSPTRRPCNTTKLLYTVKTNQPLYSHASVRTKHAQDDARKDGR